MTSKRRLGAVLAVLGLGLAPLAAGAIGAQAATTAGSQVTGVMGGVTPNGTSFVISFSATQTVDGQTRPALIDQEIQVVGTPVHVSPRPITVTPVDARSAKPEVMLALDTSDSMKGARFAAQKAAARTFLDKVQGSGIAVGLVTFGDPAHVELAPTLDLDVVRAHVEHLSTKGNTAMYQAVVLAAGELDTAGYRSILMITDGKNDDKGPTTLLPTAREALTAKDRSRGPINFAGVLVGNDAAVHDIAGIAGRPAVVHAEDGSGLSTILNGVVTTAVESLTKSVTVQGSIPASWAGQFVSFDVKATSGGVPLNLLSPGAVFGSAPVSTTPVATAPAPVSSRMVGITTPVVVVAVIALFVALTVLLSLTTGALAGSGDQESTVIRRLEMYSVTGGTPSRVAVTEQATKLGDSVLARSAVGLMASLARRSQIDRNLDGKLEAAGLPLRTAEWLLLHIGITVGATLLLLLASGGKIVAGLLGLVLGAVLPWLFLTFSKGRREGKFLSQLPDTLQLLAGSLAAGYSLPQAMDAVVRESAPPISVEFNRALIEARLGMPPEDALDGIARRTGSQDFSWIVMAIRIQRDVGGNLAELLSSVAGTLRERERLRRQVSALSAEGKLSGAILGALPIVFALYLILTKPDYIAPLFNTSIGIFMLIVGGVALAIGGFWMTKVIKVEV